MIKINIWGMLMGLSEIIQSPIDINKNNIVYYKDKIVVDDSFDVRSYFSNSIEFGVFSCNDVIEFCTNTVVKRIGEIILDGTEEWLYDSITKTYYFHQENKFHIPCGGFFDTMLCTHFTWRQYSEIPLYGTIQGRSENEIMFNYDFGKGGVSNFIDWLQVQVSKNFPVKVLFVLQEPIISHIELPSPKPRFIPKHYFIESHDDVNPTISIHSSVIHKPY